MCWCYTCVVTVSHNLLVTLVTSHCMWPPWYVPSVQLHLCYLSICILCLTTNYHQYSHVKLLSMMTTYVDMVAGNHTQWPGLTTLMTMCLQFPSCQVQTLPLLLLISVVSLPDCNWNPTIRDIFVDNLSINIIQTTVSCRKNTKMF